MNIRLSITLIFFISFSGFSQQLSINGHVKDENNLPISYCNVTVRELQDKTSITGTVTDDNGLFMIENLKATDYILNVSYLGFNTFQDTIRLRKSLTIKDILLKEQSQDLEGVTIIAKRPTVKRKVDRLVFNVENSTLSNNNVLDVLKHTPGVIVSNDKITIKQVEPVVYINDKKIHLSAHDVQQLLKGTTATNLKLIEVITNPPAKYEAEGGAVINIITNKNIIAGYHGSIFGDCKQGYKFPKYFVGSSHFFKAEKLNAYLNYNISPRKEFILNEEFINFFEPNNQENEETSNWETTYKRFKKSSDQSINANIDYEIDEKNNIGFSTNILVTPRETNKANVDSYTEVFNINKSLDSTFKSLNRSVNEIFNLAFSLDYTHKFKKKGEKLFFNAHHTYYDSSNFQDVNTDYFNGNEEPIRDNKFQTFSSQIIKLSTGQVDYTLPINNSSQFEMGGKVSKINSENILNRFTFENEVKEKDIENSDRFFYDETNYALYSSYNKDWDKWSLKAGLRIEFTNINNNSISIREKNSANYTQFFPSLNILNRINEEDEVYINYNRRIYRPRYNQLNPFKFFLNDNSFITGDPSLKPQIDDQFILGYTFNKKYTFEAYYRFENNPTIQMILQDNNDQKIVYKNTNINQSISYGLDFLTYTQISNFWNVYVISSLYYYENKFSAFESGNVPYVTERWNLYSEVNNYLSFLKDNSLTSNLSFRYISPIVDGPSMASESYSLDVILKKTLWNNRASLSIGVTDIFNTSNVNTTTRYLNQDTYYTSRRENRLFTFGFNYKFGNYNLKNNRKVINSEERDRL